MRDLDAIASRQHGLVTRRQLRDIQFPSVRVRRWVQTGRLTQIYSNVFSLPGSVPTPHRNVLACVLETGTDAWASHTTAAWLWGLSGFEATPVNVVVNRHSRHHEHLTWTVHQFTGLPAHHRRVVDGISVTSPALTMLHLAQIVTRPRLSRAIDNAWSARILTGKDLFDLDTELARKGRNGIVALREEAEKRGIDWIPPESNLESRFMELVDPLGRNGFRRQAHISGDGWSARVDFIHERSRTIFEIQSERYHASLTDRESDRRRIARLERAGYRVIEIWDRELFHHPNEVIRRVHRAIFRVA